MIEVELSERAAVDIDVCRLCHFVWFDMREVETLIPRPLPAAAPEMPQAAREAIAMLKVEELAEQARGTDFDSAPPDEGWKQIAAFLGMPIEFDAAPQERRPWATWMLCLLIISASTFAFTQLHEIVSRFGLIPAQAMRSGGLTFLTSFFLMPAFCTLSATFISSSCSEMMWRIFCGHFATSPWSSSLPLSAISRILRLIRPPKSHVSAPAAAFPV